MIVLDLCCGNRTWSRIWSYYKHIVHTLDNNPDLYPTYCMDILAFKTAIKYDIILASPPCTYFSLIRNAYNGTSKQTTPDQLNNAIMIAKKVFEIIDKIKPKYYIVENPYHKNGMVKYFPDRADHHIVNYCMYGMPERKNTSLWSNIPIEYKRCNHHRNEHQAFRTNNNHGLDRASIPANLAVAVYSKIQELENV